MFEVKKAERKGVSVFIQIAGLSDSGKTYTALSIARGLVGADGTIGFTDTENGRGSYYADMFGGYSIIDLQPPFSPERYSETVDAFEKGKFDCQIIDSMSHEWEGVGGILDIADSQRSKYDKPLEGMNKWIKPKKMHRDLMDKIVRSKMHSICCYRVKEPLEEVVIDGKKTLQKGEPTTVTEPESHKKYDATISIVVCHDPSGRRGVVERVIKCPEQLLYLFKVGTQLSEATGSGVKQWLAGTRRTEAEVISEGKKQKDLKKWYSSLPPHEQQIATARKDEISPPKVTEVKADTDTLEDL